MGRRATEDNPSGGGTLGVYVFHLAIYKLLQFRIIGDLYIDNTPIAVYYILVLLLWMSLFWLSYGLTVLSRRNSVLSVILLGEK